MISESMRLQPSWWGSLYREKFSVGAMIAAIVFTLLAFYTAVKFEKIKES